MTALWATIGFTTYTKMQKDPSGYLTLSHFMGVDCFYPRTKTFIHYKIPDVQKYVAYSIAEDNHENILVGTDHGLLKIGRTTHEIKLYKAEDGLTNNAVFSVLK